MRKLPLLGLTGALVLTGLGVWAQADDPFADIVETRHGLMMQMASDVGKMGAMIKGEAPYDATIAAKAAANVAAIASVISMDQFPAGSEVGKSADSFAKADIWAAQDDFLSKIADLNTAAEAMKAAAGTDAESMKAGVMALGKACSACHTSYRQSEG
ncbi:MAG: cytochrome c [Pseudomonadota bacterium]